MSRRHRILGIDPGSRMTGFGVLDFEGDRPVYVASGSVQSGNGAFPERLKLIYDSIRRIADEYRPDVLAIESVFVHKNAGSALKLGHARSAALCASFALDVEVYEYAPREIKQAVVGNGGATNDAKPSTATATTARSRTSTASWAGSSRGWSTKRSSRRRS